MEDKNLLKEAKTLFNNLKIDPFSALFSEERTNNRLMKKLKKIEIFKRHSAIKTYKFS